MKQAFTTMDTRYSASKWSSIMGIRRKRPSGAIGIIIHCLTWKRREVVMVSMDWRFN